jgi:hypothetical protein
VSLLPTEADQFAPGGSLGMTVLERIVTIVVEVIGAVVGGAIGFFTFGWMVQRGVYAGLLPGGLLGLGCAVVARRPSLARGILCGIAGLALSVFAESWYMNFTARGHETLLYYFNHLQDVSHVDWLFVAVGTLLAFWIGKDAGFRRGRPPSEDSRLRE